MDAEAWIAEVEDHEVITVGDAKEAAWSVIEEEFDSEFLDLLEHFNLIDQADGFMLSMRASIDLSIEGIIRARRVRDGESPCPDNS